MQTPDRIDRATKVALAVWLHSAGEKIVDSPEGHVDRIIRALDAVGLLDADGRGDRLEAMVERMASKAVEALDLHGDEPGLKSTRICRTCHVVQPCPTTLVLQADAVEAQQRHDAEIAARAWDEGHTAGVRNASAEFDGPVQDNPYKREGGASDGE